MVQKTQIRKDIPPIKRIELVIEEFEQIRYDGKGFEPSDKTAYYTIKG